MKFKEKLKKNIRKYISVACFLLLIPIFSVNAFAYEYFTFTPIVRDHMYLELNGIDSILTSTTEMSVTSGNTYTYSFGSGSVANYTISSMSFGSQKGLLRYVYDSDLYDYYVVGNLGINFARVNNINSSFNGFSSIRIHNFDNNVHSYDTVIPQVDFATSELGYNYNFVFPLEEYSNLSILEFMFDTPLVFSNRKDTGVFFTYAIFSVSKGTSQEQVNSIISAINNQTDIIENGNSGTQSAVSDFNEVFEDFNRELDTWEQFDDDIIGEFNNANEDYLAELDNFSLSGSLLNAGTWLSTSMQTVYDNSSDYKMLWLVPLLFGIPILLFIIRKNGDDE